MKFETTITVDPIVAETMQDLIDYDGLTDDDDDCQFFDEIMYSNGAKVSVAINSKSFMKDSPYAQVCLYIDGELVKASNNYEKFLGAYNLKIEDDEYVLNVVAE
jgi:hypothetical protein